MKTRLIAGAAAVFVGTTLGGCSAGEGGNDEPTRESPEAPTASDAPLCDSVWSEGDVLPEDYRNCMVEPGAEAAQGNAIECADGRALASWEEYWAFAGEPVQRFQDGFEDDPNGDPPFQAATDECLAS